MRDVVSNCGIVCSCHCGPAGVLASFHRRCWKASTGIKIAAGSHARQDSGECAEEVACGAEISRPSALGKPAEDRGKFFASFLAAALTSANPG
jgi:hypothetical protein